MKSKKPFTLRKSVEAGMISRLRSAHIHLIQKVVRPRAGVLTIMSMFVMLGSLLMLQGTPQAFAQTQASSLAAAPAVTVPATTTSYYEDSTNLNSQGCKAIGTSGLVVLDFGQPDRRGNTYGADLFSPGGFASDSTILGAVKSFISGAWRCHTGSKNLIVAIGTNNYNNALGGNASNATWYTAGQQWGNLVNNAVKYISTHSWVGAYGADDIETQWANYARSSNFVAGYNKNTSVDFINYGDDFGQWSNAQLWYIAYGARDDFTIPQIYDTSWAATYWEPLSVWGCEHEGGAIAFLGTMSTGGFASPSASYTALYNALGSNSCTKAKRSTMRYETFIKFA